MQRPPKTNEIKAISALAAMSALLLSCSSSPNEPLETIRLIKAEIQIPTQIHQGASQVGWYDDQTYLVLPNDSFVIYKVTGNSVNTLPHTQKFPSSRSSYTNGFIQNSSGHPFLIDGDGGVYMISDSIKKYPLPALSRPGIHSASLTSSGSIYACGIAGVWKAAQTDTILSVIPQLNSYNTSALYIDDTIGILSRNNTIILFKNDTATRVINFNEIGLEPSPGLGFSTEWIGKMNGNYYVFQGIRGVKLSPTGDVLSTLTTPVSQIVSFTDGDCFFTKRMDLEVWCDDGNSVAKFTAANSDLYEEMIFAGRNSQGYWISDGKRLILLDLEKAKSIARNN